MEPAAPVDDAVPNKESGATKTVDRGQIALDWTKALGTPLATLIVTVFGGFYLTNLAKEREARLSDDRLYAELLAQREQSDAPIRTQIFGMLLNDLLVDPKPGDWTKMIVELDLLTSSFDQSLDVGPLLKYSARRLQEANDLAADQRIELTRQLDKMASSAIFKQMSRLQRHGNAYVLDQQVALGEWEANLGKPVFDGSIPAATLVRPGVDALFEERRPSKVRVEIIGVDIERREIVVRLRVHSSDHKVEYFDGHFWVGPYDLPLTVNTKLEFGLRVAVVMTDFSASKASTNRKRNGYASLHLVVFPAMSGSFRDREDYDDILLDLLRSRNEKGRL